MNRGWFITGTDTGIGKTVVSAMLLLQFKEMGRRVMYMKPVQTGCETRDTERVAPDPEFCLRLAGLTPNADEYADICPYRLLMPTSPHLAAAQENVVISLDRIVSSFRRLQERYDPIIVEGAGGVLVPLNKQDTMLTLMQRLNLPVVVVCRAGLGTLNHTLLTVRAVQDAGLRVEGLVLVQTTNEPWGAIETDNEKTLRRLTKIPIFGRIPYHAALADGTATPGTLRTCDLLARSIR